MMKHVSKSRHGLGTARLLLPLPTELRAPDPIDIVRWYGLKPDERAPVRSVALFDVVGHKLFALIVDTVDGQPKWLVVGETSQLALLHDGVLGDWAHLRGTALLSVRLPPRLVKRYPVAQRRFEKAGAPAVEDNCSPHPLAEAVRGDYPGGGSPGVVVVVSVVSDVIAGFSDSSSVEVTDGNGGNQDALDVPLGS
jgi:hypothetical protein